MKKIMVIIGAVFTSLLLVSTATAVPKTHSEPAMNLIDEIEQKTSVIDGLKGKINAVDVLENTGIIDWFIQLLRAILNFIYHLIQLVIDLFQIIQLLEAIISAINQLVDLIVQFINRIIDIFTPNMANTKLVIQ